MAVPSKLIAVVVTDTSSAKDGSSRTSSLFTSCKGVMFPSVVLYLRGNLFFPLNPPIGLLFVSQNQTGLSLMTI